MFIFYVKNQKMIYFSIFFTVLNLSFDNFEQNYLIFLKLCSKIALYFEDCVL